MAVAQEVKEGGAPVIEVDGPQSPVTGAQAAAKGAASRANRRGSVIEMSGQQKSVLKNILGRKTGAAPAGNQPPQAK